MRDDYQPAFQQLWAAEAMEGRIWLPESVSDWAGYTSALALRRIRASGVVVNPHIYIATNSGTNEHWDLVAEMEHCTREAPALRLYCTACYSAVSAGLNILIAGSKGCRRAHENTEFGFHGNGSPPQRSRDERKADFYGRHTNEPSEFWLEKAIAGALWTFDAPQALELGIIDEILYGPVPWSDPIIY